MWLSFSAFACGGGDSSGSNAPVATVTVTPNPVTVKVDSTVQLSATLKDAGGNALSGRTVAWSTGDAAVATVSAAGVVTGVAAGAANISATSEGKTDSSAVSVTPAAPQSSGSGVIVGPYSKSGDFDDNDFPPDLPEFDPVDDDWDIALPEPLPGPNDPDFVPTPDYEFPPVSPVEGFPGEQLGFSRTAALRTSRAQADTTVLFAGGYKSPTGFASTRRAIIYTPATGLVRARQMTEARIYHTLTRLLDARALVAGGFDGDAVRSSAEIYSDETKTFTATGSMGTARGRHAAARLADGRVLITGGLAPDNGGPATIDVKSTEIYDPVAGTFTPGPDMSVPRFNHSAIALGDGRVLVLGGNNRKSAEVYDPTTNTFTPVGDMGVNHGLGHKAVRLLDGKVLVTGGDLGINIQPSAVAELFDPATDTFTPVGDMTTTRMLHFAVLVETTGDVLVGGGQDASGEVLASAELYDPVAKTFRAVADMPRPGSELAAIFLTR